MKGSFSSGKSICCMISWSVLWTHPNFFIYNFCVTLFKPDGCGQRFATYLSAKSVRNLVARDCEPFVLNGD